MIIKDENEVVYCKNQTELVREYLKQGNSLTTLEAMLKLNISRLANHIYELRKKGVNIRSERINQENGKHHYRYWLDADAKTA